MLPENIQTHVSLTQEYWQRVEPAIEAILRELPHFDRIIERQIRHAVMDQCSREAGFYMQQELGQMPPSINYPVKAPTIGEKERQELDKVRRIGRWYYADPKRRTYEDAAVLFQVSRATVGRCLKKYREIMRDQE